MALRWLADTTGQAVTPQVLEFTGGAPLRAFRDPVTNSELRASVSHGLLELALRDGSYDWRFVATRGEFSDRGTANCH